MEEGSVEKKSPEDTASCAKTLSPFYLTGEKNPRQPIKKPGALPPALFGWERESTFSDRMFRSPRANDNAGKQGIEESLSSSFFPLLRAWVEAGLATETAYNDLNLGRTCNPFQESTERSGRHPHQFSRHLWYLGAISWGCSFLRGSHGGKRRRLLKDEGRKRTSTPIRFNKAADQLINSSPPPPLPASFAAHPLQKSTSPSFPPLWTVGKPTLRTRRGVPQ
ncbi:hypothetical protein GWK47_031364 [Chionoecetes opilio]|uniref:Uncharacterized protein n=1 Tax=Chionoecetes opilio TaxID=41210 RepID=A0A8J5D4B5_CHIOP|nr:hypothetical protein GWK47_031364 [Chionoecetes opilio]